MAVTGKLSVNVSLNQSKDLGTATAKSDVAIVDSWRVGNGVAIDQADVLYSEEKTLATGANEELDLDSVLEDIYGDGANFARLKGIIIKIKSGQAKLLVGGAASNAFPSMFNDVTDKLVVEDMFVLFSRRGNAYPVTAATGDILRFEHDASDGADLVYDLILLGASA